MNERTEKTLNEVQLDFAFFAKAISETMKPSPSGASVPVRIARAAKPRGLVETLAAARAALLDAPLSDINTQLVPLFEFCEAALTRALDVVPQRKEEVFSQEEYRSLRGIGQAQWLLTEAYGKHQAKPTLARERKRGKKKSESRIQNLEE